MRQTLRPTSLQIRAAIERRRRMLIWGMLAATWLPFASPTSAQDQRSSEGPVADHGSQPANESRLLTTADENSAAASSNQPTTTVPLGQINPGPAKENWVRNSLAWMLQQGTDCGWQIVDRVASKRAAAKPLLVSDLVHYGPQSDEDPSIAKRVFGCRLLMFNYGDQELDFGRNEITLFVDGIATKIKSLQLVPADFTQPTAVWLSRPNDSEPESANNRVIVARRSWRSFGVVVTGLPPSSHVPALRIEIKSTNGIIAADISEQQRRELTIRARRVGPGSRCLVLTISGSLDTVNVGNLVDEINRGATNSVNRVVLAFEPAVVSEHGSDSGPIPEISSPLLVEWLKGMAGTNVSELSESFPFPAVTARVSELHIAGMRTAGETNGADESGATSVGATAAGTTESGTTAASSATAHTDELRPRRSGVYGPFLHHRADAAIVAACADAYLAAPYDDAILAIRTGTPADKMSALVGAAGRFPVETLPLVLAACRDADPLMQQAGMIAASHFGEPAAISYLTEIVATGKEPAASAAVAALARSRFQAAHVALLRLLGTRDAAARSSWVRILAKHPRPIWSKPLQQLVSRNSASESPAALRALSEVGHPELPRILRESLASPVPELQSEAFRLLASRTDRDSESAALKFAMQHLEKGEVTTPALELLNRCKPPEAVPALLAAFDKSEFKSQLIDTLFLLGHRNVIEPLVNRMPTLEPHERGAVLNGLQRFDAPLFRKLAREALLDSDTTVAAFAVQGLQDDGTPASVQVLIEVFEAEPAPTSWGVAGSALAAIGSTEARLALLRARATGNPERRSAAANMLRQIQQRSPGYRHVFEAQRYSQQEKWTEAIEQLSLAIKLDDQLGDAFAERGSAYIRTGDLPAADTDFRKALELDPYSPSAVTGSCVVAVIKDGQVADAVARLEARRNDFPNNPLFSYNAACVYGRCVEWLQQHPGEPAAEEQRTKYIKHAMDDLERSIQQGYQEFGWMRKDPDLKSLHGIAEFEKLTQPGVVPPAAG